jgi:hypothetical protein
MTIAISEAYISRGGTRGEATSYDLVYYSMNETDETLAQAAVLAAIPASYDGFPFRTLAREQLLDHLWKWTANYGSPGNQVTTERPTLSFNVGGGTSHITNSIRNQRYRDPTLVPQDIDYKGAIGVELNDDGSKARVRGVEVFTPLLEYSYSQQFENADVTEAYIDGLFSIAGTVNSIPFYGRPAASVLFKQARGSKKGSDKWEISFDFCYSPNMSSFNVGSINVQQKDGWDYLDVLYVSAGRTAKGIRIMQPGMATVHKVYPDGDFTLLGIGT